MKLSNPSFRMGSISRRSSLSALSAVMHRPPSVVMAAFTLVLLASMVIVRPVLAASTYTVNRIDDITPRGVAATCNGTPSDCTLREAVIKANANPGSTIVVPAGTYQLTIDGAAEGGLCINEAIGDLDIAGNNTTISGAGAATTIIQQTRPNDRVICVDQNLVGNFTFSISGVTIAGGRETFGVGGGGIVSGAPGDVTNITNVVFANNQVSGVGSPVGGGLANGAGTLNVTGSTFGGSNLPCASQTDLTCGNQSAGGGGGLYFSDNNNGTGKLTLSNSTFSKNVSTGGNGGGLLATQATPSHDISACTFTGNRAQGNNGRGGAIYNESGTMAVLKSIFLNNQVTNALTLGGGGAIGSADGAGHNVTVTYSRFVGNTSNVASLGNVVHGGSGSTMTANDNWWAINTGPATNDAVGATVSNYLRMTNTANPATIDVNQSTELTASFLTDSAGNAIGVSNLSVMIGLPLTFNNPVRGSLSAAQTSVQSDGTATAMFLASAAGAGSADATVDSGVATTSPTITINKGQTTTTLTSDLPDPSVVGQSVVVSYTVAQVIPGATTPSTGSIVTVTDGASFCTGTVSAGACTLTLTSAGAKSLTATYGGDSNFLSSVSSPATAHTVNKADTTTTITSDLPDPSVTGQPITVAYAVTVNSPGAGAPTGNVTVSDGTTSCTATVAAGSCSLAFPSVGARSLTATYAGDSNFNGSASTPATAHTVNKANTSTTISADLPDPSQLGETVVVSYTVAAVAPGGGTPTGSVTVTNGAASCTGTVADGACSLSFATAGAKSLTATYGGDSNFNGSASSPATTHTVSKADTTTTISSDTPDPSVVGQAVAVSFSVTSLRPGTPTGNVTVSDGTASCTGTVAAGSCSITFASAGAKSLTATYAGDSNFNSSASSPVTAHTVNKADTTTTITSDLPDPSVVGQPITVTFSVAVTAPGAGTPTGNVTVSDGASSCTGAVAAGGCMLTFPSPGTKSLTATYGGNSNFNGSASTPAASHTVNKADSVTTITSDLPDPSFVGEAVIVSFSVDLAAPGAGPATGNVTVSDGTVSCTATIAVGWCTLTFNVAGPVALTATYAGDSNVNGSVSTPATTHTVEKAGTTTTISSDLPDPSVVGQPITVTYSVVVTPPQTGTPTGDVTVSDGTASCTGTVAAGSCLLTPTSAGAKSLTATYGGDTNFDSSVSSPATAHTVQKANTTTALTSDIPDPSVVGQPVTVTYSVSAVAPGAGTPGGNVTVSDGTASCTATAAAGSCAITFASTGAKSLTATYAGDSSYNGSASSPATAHTVNSADTTTTITGDLPDPSVVGQAVTVTFGVAVTAPGSGTPTGNVTVSDGTVSCTAAVAAGGCSITFTSAGAKSLTAIYVGDSNFNGSGSSPATAHTVNKANTTTTITSDLPDPSLVGESVTVNYTVVAAAPGAGTPSGDVTVSDGTASCTGTVAAGSCLIAFSSDGAKSLTATYVGDSNFNGSASSPATAHTVNKAATTTTISSDLPDPSVVGQSVTVSYTVTSTASGTPTGDVTVSDGSVSCTGTVAAGSCSLTFTSAGAKSLTATYGGDANFAGSASTPATAHTVNKAGATTTIASDLPDPSVVGEAVAVAYTVVANAPGAGTPTGNVTVSDGTVSCTGTVAAGSCSLTFTTTGAKSLTATYAGDSNFNGSASTPATAHTVNKADTTTTITGDLPDPSVVGQVITVTFSVSVNAPGAGTPTGSVTVGDGTVSCTGAVTGGSGACALTFTSVGAKSLTAAYTGDSSFNGSTSTPATTHTVNKAGTTTTIISDLPDPSVVGEAVTVTFSVAAVTPPAGAPTSNAGLAILAPGTITPTGNVTISDGTASCTGTVAAGSCSLAFSSVGAKSLTATYAGDANFSGSVSSPVTAHTVNKANTVTAITADAPNPSVVGQVVTVTYSVNVTAPGAGTPTGNVTVSDGTISCTGTVAAGSCTLIFASTGGKSLTASYAGDSNFVASASAPALHTVNKAPATVVVTAAPSPSVFSRNVTFTATVTSIAGTPTGSVEFGEGVTTYVSATIVNGVATFTTDALSIGAHTITANYSGNDTVLPGSGSKLHTVRPMGIQISKTADYTTWYAGYNYVYRINVTNANPITASNVIVTDALPTQLFLIELPPGALRNADGSITWHIATLAPWENRQLALQVRSISSMRGDLTNTASAVCDNGEVAFSNHTMTFVAAPPVNTPTATPTAVPTVPVNLCPQTAVLRVASGRTTSYTDSTGKVWPADQVYRPGVTTWGYIEAAKSATYATSHAISNTSDPPLYQVERWWTGNGGYRAELPNGYYRVALGFAEIYPWATRGARVFDVAVQGVTMMRDLDVAARVGQYTAYTVTLDANVTNGLLSIDFLSHAGSPAIQSIAVFTLTECDGGATGPTPTPTATATPTQAASATGALYRVNAGGASYVDAQGYTWAADKAFSAGGWGYVGGFTSSQTTAIRNTNDDPLYQSERWWNGNGVYKFTLPNGTYDVVLKFAEIYPSAYRGARVFDVKVEGALVRSGLDIAATVGMYTPIDVAVPGVIVSDGVLQVDLTSRTGSPKISAISITAAGH